MLPNYYSKQLLAMHIVAKLVYAVGLDINCLAYSNAFAYFTKTIY